MSRKMHLRIPLYCVENFIEHFLLFSVYLRIGGVCAIVQVASTALLSIFSGLHCAMIINNKNIIIKYSTNIFLSFLSAVVAGMNVNPSTSSNQFESEPPL